MDHYEKKFFLSKEKEEFWLNHRAMNGLSLKLYKHKIYVFEKSSKDKPYHYRVELLKKPYKKSDITFPKGIDVVGEEGRWVYLRKDAQKGGFDFYKDLPLKLTYYKQLILINMALFIGLVLLGVISLVVVINNTSIILVILGVIFGLSALIPLYLLIYLFRIRLLLKKSQKE